MMSQKIKPAVITLVAKNAKGDEIQYCLPQHEGVFIGRSRNCGFRLPDEGIADIHCRVEYESGQLWIQDWMSKRDGWREDFKRKHKDALRRQKRNRQGGDKFYE